MSLSTMPSWSTSFHWIINIHGLPIDLKLAGIARVATGASWRVAVFYVVMTFLAEVVAGWRATDGPWTSDVVISADLCDSIADTAAKGTAIVVKAAEKTKEKDGAQLVLLTIYN